MDAIVIQVALIAGLVLVMGLVMTGGAPPPAIEIKMLLVVPRCHVGNEVVGMIPCPVARMTIDPELLTP
jgi:hypothetical protein